MRWLLRLPGPLLRGVIRLGRLLDRLNLLPGFMMREDPLFASVFVANLGSVGVDRVWHHLYEHGTISVFCAIGAIADEVMPGPDGQPVVRPCVRVTYTFDERINDGHYCAAALGLVRELVEHPDRLLAAATDLAGVAERDTLAQARAYATEAGSP